MGRKRKYGPHLVKKFDELRKADPSPVQEEAAKQAILWSGGLPADDKHIHGLIRRWRIDSKKPGGIADKIEPPKEVRDQYAKARAGRMDPDHLVRDLVTRFAELECLLYEEHLSSFSRLVPPFRPGRHGLTTAIDREIDSMQVRAYESDVLMSEMLEADATESEFSEEWVRRRDAYQDFLKFKALVKKISRFCWALLGTQDGKNAWEKFGTEQEESRLEQEKS